MFAFCYKFFGSRLIHTAAVLVRHKEILVRRHHSNALLGNAYTRGLLEQQLTSQKKTLNDFFAMDENQVRETLATIVAPPMVPRIGMCVCRDACVKT